MRLSDDSHRMRFGTLVYHLVRVEVVRRSVTESVNVGGIIVPLPTGLEAWVQLGRKEPDETVLYFTENVTKRLLAILLTTKGMEPVGQAPAVGVDVYSDLLKKTTVSRQKWEWRQPRKGQADAEVAAASAGASMPRRTRWRSGMPDMCTWDGPRAVVERTENCTEDRCT